MANKLSFVGEKVKLGEVCAINSGGTPKRTVQDYWVDGTIPWVKISDIRQKFVIETEEFITEEGLTHSSAKLLEPDTLLFSIFASIGAVGILDMPAATNQAIAGLKIIAPNVERDYLYHWLKAQEAVSKMAGRGAAQSNINLTILRNMEIIIPDIETQKSLIRQFNVIEKQKILAQKQLTKLDQLIKSRFVEMFGKTRDFDNAPIEAVCDLIVDCPHETPKYEGQLMYPAIRTSEIGHGHILWNTMKYVSQTEYERRTKRALPQIEDIVYAREGSYGNAIMLPPGQAFCLGQRTMLFRPNKTLVHPAYLLWAILSDDFKKQADALNVGSTVPHVNVRDAKKFFIPLPPFSLQQEFAAFVTQVDKLRFVKQ